MAHNTDITPTKSYKKTKLGRVPEDWRAIKFGEIIYKLGYGPRFSGKDYNENGNVKTIRGTDIGQNGNILYNQVPIANLNENFIKPHLLKIGDLVMITTADCGVTGVFDSNDYKYIPSAYAVKISLTNKAEPIYFKYFVQSDIIKRQVLRFVRKGTVANLPGSDISKFEFPLPPLKEQQKIATILSTWDTAITAQQKLITQKQQLKKGLMQLLLTGKKRFGGFIEKWKKIELQATGTIIRGASPRPKGDPKYYGGSVPRLMVKDVTRDGKYVTPQIDFLTEAGAKKSRLCKAGTLTIVCSGDVGVPSFLAVDACIHDGFLAIVNINHNIINSEYLYYQLKRLRSRLERSATHGGVFTNLTTTILKEFIIEIPSLKEQVQIIKVLSKADNEVNLLIEKLEVLKKQKQGLMQRLLTGEVRVKI